MYVVLIEYCFINVDSSKHHQVCIKFKNDSQRQLISNSNKIDAKYSKSIGFITLFKISEECHCLHVSKITTNRPSMKYTASDFKH